MSEMFASEKALLRFYKLPLPSFLRACVLA